MESYITHAFCSAGECEVWYGGSHLHFRKGDCMIVVANRQVTHLKPSEDFRVSVVYVDLDFINVCAPHSNYGTRGGMFLYISPIMCLNEEEQNEALATTPVEELLELPFLKAIDDTLKAYQYSKRCNVLRVMMEATRWGRRGATVNSISPGIIITPLANDELHGPRKDGYLKMIEGMPARRAGTPDEVGDLAEFLMSSRGRFISGADLLIDGGCTASYWYGDLQYLKTTH